MLILLFSLFTTLIDVITQLALSFYKLNSFYNMKTFSVTYCQITYKIT